MTIPAHITTATAVSSSGLGERNRPRSATMTVVSCVLPPLIVVYVLGAVGAAPPYDFAHQFGVGGMIETASALMLIVGATAAAITFYIKQKSSPSPRIYVWLAASGALIWLAVDGLILLPRKLGLLISPTTDVMPAHWTSGSVLACGAVAAAGLALFYRELRRPALVLEFLLAGLVMAGIQIGTDMLTEQQATISLISGQSAGILAASQFMLAMTAACVDLIDRHFAPGRPVLDWLINPTP